MRLLLMLSPLAVSILILALIAGTASGQAGLPSPEDILQKVDANLTSDTRVFESKMIVHGARGSRTITARTWSRNNMDAFTEYLAPAREKGNKMLKLTDSLWIFSRTSDRIIKISGHMLRQSVLGSDLSYEDMMEVRKWTDLYTAAIIGEETVDGRPAWVLDLQAKVEDVAYARCKVWVDREYFIPVKEELYAKSGQLLKTTLMGQVVRINDRWFPMKVTFRDMLKNGKGTEFIITDIQFDVAIPEYVFSKASLRK